MCTTVSVRQTGHLSSRILHRVEHGLTGDPPTWNGTTRQNTQPRNDNCGYASVGAQLALKVTLFTCTEACQGELVSTAVRDSLPFYSTGEESNWVLGEQKIDHSSSCDFNNCILLLSLSPELEVRSPKHRVCVNECVRLPEWVLSIVVSSRGQEHGNTSVRIFIACV